MPDSTVDDLENDWAMEGFDPSRDAWVAEGPAGLLGYAYAGDQFRTGELEADLWVHPDYHEPELGARLLGLCERRAAQLALERGYSDGSLDVFCSTANRAKRDLLRRHGYALVRTVYRMTTDLSRGAPLTETPEGLEIRPFRLEDDERTLYELMNEAFVDHFRQSQEPFDAWRARLLGHADFRPELWWIAWDGKEAAGGLIAYDHGDLGWIKGLGVRRPWRRRGLGPPCWGTLSRRSSRAGSCAWTSAWTPRAPPRRCGCTSAPACRRPRLTRCTPSPSPADPDAPRPSASSRPCDIMRAMNAARASSPRSIRPARPGLDARVRVPGSKSVTNRALLLAGLASGESVLHGALAAGDTDAFAAGLRTLGVCVERRGDDLHVSGAGGRFPAARAEVFCSEAGTAARFLLAAAAAGEGIYRFDAARSCGAGR